VTFTILHKSLNMSTSTLNRLAGLSCRAKSVSRTAQRITRSRRTFCGSASRRTDGVFRELTAMRTPTPWIEAFNRRKEQEEKEKSGVAPESSGSDAAGQTSSKPQTPLPPKRMSESYHSVVGVFLLSYSLNSVTLMLSLRCLTSVIVKELSFA
jgi:hypothetical protein